MITTPGYMKEIEDAAWVQEVIMETFDGALELLGPHDAVYGGAVRDCLAGMELVGDLDIAVSAPDFKRLSDRFINSTRWAPKSEAGGILPPGFGKTGPSVAKFGRGGSGEIARANAPMSGVTAFRGMSGREAQIITSKQRTKDHLQDALYMARMVDIICCGVVLTSDGRVFEVVPGAYDDCRNRVLRLNEASETMYIEALPERTKKLIDRGWTNEIDVEKVMRDLKLAEERNRRKAERQRQAMLNKKKRQNLQKPELFGGVVMEHIFIGDKSQPAPKDGGEMAEVEGTMFNMYMGNPKEILGILEGIAITEGLNIRVKIAPIGKIYFSGIDHHTTWKVRQCLSKHVTQRKRPMRKKKFPSIPTTGISSEQRLSSSPQAQVASNRLLYQSPNVIGPGIHKIVVFSDDNAAIDVRDMRDGQIYDISISVSYTNARAIHDAWVNGDSGERESILRQIVNLALEHEGSQSNA